MTNVVVFKPPAKRPPSPVEGVFQLLFFTGIRYVRGDEPLIAKPRKPRATRRKKRA
jgi:hypothetical protein